MKKETKTCSIHEESFTFYGSYMDAAAMISDDAARLEYLWALPCYAFKDTEPEFEYETAAIAFEASRPLLDRSIARRDLKADAASRAGKYLYPREQKREGFDAIR